MAGPEIKTLRDQIAWVYANLAKAHAAKEAGATRYKPVHYAIRSRMFTGLISGTLSMRTIYDDERLKMTMPQCCVYCGSKKNLSLDHLISRKAGGVDYPENIVWACRSCNSSKSDSDLMDWMLSKGRFPSILVFRRYLKLVFSYCMNNNILDVPLSEAENYSLPFSLNGLRADFPGLGELLLWVTEESLEV